MSTVKLATLGRPETNNRLLQRAWRQQGPHYEVEVHYNDDELSDRAKQMLAAAEGYFTTFLDNDDLTPTLHRRRRVLGVVEAAEALEAKSDADRENMRRRAEAIAKVYRGHCEERVEPFDFIAPLARPDDLHDAAAYLNRLAETPGLGVRATLNSPIVWLDDELVDVGGIPWEFMLRLRAY
jgi:hypothetical protein